MVPITLVDYEEFLADALGDPARACHLYALARGAADSTPKIILHQTARLVSLADWMDEVAPHRPALKIFFLVVLAEAVAKMAFAFTGRGESRAHVHLFFEKICAVPDREVLATSFRRTDTPLQCMLTASEAVDVLYNVRNSVVHRGEYFQFNLLEPGEDATLTVFEDRELLALLSPLEFRAVVIRGAVTAVENLLSSR